MEIFLIDGIGPFFRDYHKRRINWSKIPFNHLPSDPGELESSFSRIGRDMSIFAKKVSSIGYNSISFDDVAHLTHDPWLEEEINHKIALFQQHFRRIFDICSGYGLAIYLTMDVLSVTPALHKKIGGSRRRARIFLKRQLETLFSLFPEISGIIIRIGECDGKDVEGDFKSRLLLRTAGQVNRMLKDLLPLFERHQRYLILRTWTVGAYQIGDLIWHRGTSARVLRGIDSKNFILSMKYGESDFFRYLPLNKHFFRIKVKKIIELQARREYEGCGEYPSFIGWDYEEYARQLDRAENMVGICVWCQTGGWLPFRRITYLDPQGIWNELNSFVTLQLFRRGISVEEAVRRFAAEKGCPDPVSLLELLRLGDEVIKELLYIREIAGRKLFFRRIRLPSLLTVFWNNVFINHSVRKVVSALVDLGEGCVESGYRALAKIRTMRDLALRSGLPAADLDFMYDTFEILALAREYYLLPYSDDIRKRIGQAKKAYKRNYPKNGRPRYRIKTSFSPFTLRSRHLKWLLRISLRSKRGYRVIDYLLTLHLLSLVYWLLSRLRPKAIPRFARKNGMGIETIFR